MQLYFIERKGNIDKNAEQMLVSFILIVGVPN